MNTPQDQHVLGIKRRAKELYLAARAAGGEITRQDYHGLFSSLPWGITVGELTDAARYLQSIGYAEIIIPDGGYIDSAETKIRTLK